MVPAVSSAVERLYDLIANEEVSNTAIGFALLAVGGLGGLASQVSVDAALAMLGLMGLAGGAGAARLPEG